MRYEFWDSSALAESDRTPRRSVVEDKIVDFVELLHDLGLSKQPYLWVLDSLEELQYEALGFLDYLWDFLIDLRERVPNLRCFLVGRSPVEPSKRDPQNELEIGSIHPRHALQLLKSLGVPAEIAKTLATFRWTPLRLRLAADIYRKTSHPGSLVTLTHQLQFVVETLSTNVGEEALAAIPRAPSR